MRGRSIRTSGGGAQLRPTQDRVRESLFSILGGLVVDCRFLDLFAGSGAVGLGAASRGAAQVTWVECRSRTLALLRQNVDSLGCSGNTSGERAAVFLKRAARQGSTFDIIFADPPYAMGRSNPDVEQLLRLGLDVTARDGLFILEQDKNGVSGVETGRDPCDRRQYGDTVLSFYRPDAGGCGE